LRADPTMATEDPDARAVALFSQALEPDLRERFDRLDPERRRVLTLRYLDRLTPVEIAAVLGTRAAGVQSRLAAGVRAMERPASAAREGAAAHDPEAVSAA
ncbi:MAG TPA: sigma-70 region 4 domain-containing protein, partial [Candidatus Sulfotelmatobacter sp.]|nr:sigma-70 region 4 domain-containing protein [Candidatus Sulfotelmatobacter sp.]